MEKRNSTIFIVLIIQCFFMKNKITVFTFFAVMSITNLYAQSIKMLTTGTNTSIRGLSVVNDNIVWASGSGGTVAKSTDGGNTWQWLIVKDYEKMDFRDIEAFDSNTAIIMGIEKPAVILKTINGGKNWYKVFEDTTKGMFLDAMSFADDETGMVIGDPVSNKPFIAMTFDQGESWIDPVKGDKSKLPTLFSNEAFFASSGTNIFIKKNNTNKLIGGFASGGMSARFFTDKEIFPLPMIQGKESTGANSVAINNANQMVIVGGDFANDKDTTGNCALSNDLGRTFTQPQTPPHGYRSCVIYINEKQLVTCGTSGIDISNDGGNNWQLISTESFHVVQKAKTGTPVFLAGSKGRIARLAY